ncbi:subtilisin-like protease SBT4.3 [Lotus japonicus]|uniref:subtilisin-like protease SBT4.3 n=1 Tax=Lotus japonicus TaxID=34305 RepID=UPI00258BC88C|nr:subtilisin-like protease SBT4.3 [Lotus japonicus]
MSYPHDAAIAAFVKSFHLDWSPTTIKPAIMTTTRPTNGSNNEDQIGECAYRSEHGNPEKALDLGLIYDIHKEDYVQLLCNLGYDNQTIKIIFGESISCSRARDGSLVRNYNHLTLVVVVEPMTSLSDVFHRTITNVGTATSNYTTTVLPN